MFIVLRFAIFTKSIVAEAHMTIEATVPEKNDDGYVCVHVFIKLSDGDWWYKIKIKMEKILCLVEHHYLS